MKNSDTIYLEDYPEIKVAGHTGHETRYYCPVCEQRRGKPDKDGKLYFNNIKRVGMCFKCNVVMRSHRVMNKEELNEWLSYKQEQEEIVEPAKLSLGFAHSIMSDPEAYSYLLKRGLTGETIQRFNIMACDSPVKGIVFNNGKDKDNCTDFLQIRNYETTDHSKRFLNVRNVLKPMVLLPFAGSDMILCEGFMSAFSAYQYLHKMLPDDDICPLVCTGKSLTNYQLSQLKEHCKKFEQPYFFVCLDGGFNKEAIKVAKQLLKGIPDASVYIVRLPDDKDPNDISFEKFVETWNNHTYRFTNNLNTYLEKKLEESYK